MAKNKAKTSKEKLKEKPKAKDKVKAKAKVQAKPPKPLKAQVKSAAKPAPTLVKASAKTKKKPKKKAEKTLSKLVKVVSKVLGVKEKSENPKELADKKAQKLNSKEAVKDAGKDSTKKTAAKERGKKGKKSKEKEEFEDDDLLAGDEDIGGEEIPDLSEFDEDELLEGEEEELLIEKSRSIEVRPAADDEIILTDAEGRRLCRVRDCDQAAVVEGYCRYHYLLLWKRIQVRRKILTDGKLQRYVEELTARYPDKFLEMIKKDLRSEKEFLQAIQELEIDESELNAEFEDDSQSFADEIRGMSESSGLSDDDEF
jgi:hypothetical protein